MDRDSIVEACRVLMRQKLSHYQYLFEGRLQDILTTIARGPQASSLARELIGGLDRVYAYSKLRLSEDSASKEAAEKLREIENRILEASPPSMRDSIEKMLRGDMTISPFFAETINVLDALEAVSFTGFIRTLSLVEDMAYREFFGLLGQELERIAISTLDSLYVRYDAEPVDPQLVARGFLQVIKPLVQDGYEKKLLGESYKVSREGALVTVYPPLEEDRLLRLFSSTIDTALSVNLNDLKGMVYDSFVSVGFRREALSSESVQILASMTKDLLVEIGQHKEIVAKSLEQASSKLVSKLANGLVQDHAFYSLFAPKMLVLAPSSPEEYLAVKRAVLRGMWGYVRRPNAEPLADLAGQELESSVYLNAIKRKLIMEEERNKVKLGELFSEGDIDAETRRKLWLLYNEVFTPGHQGSLSHLLANCGYGARLTRLESTRAWLAAIVSSIPVLLELATELVEAIAKRGRRDILRAKVSEDYVKETLLPGVVSMAPLAAYYFDVMEAPHLHREDKACVMRTLTRELVTDMSYREVATIAERINESIMSLAHVEGRASRRRQ